jgi:hypothetical protein
MNKFSPALSTLRTRYASVLLSIFMAVVWQSATANPLSTEFTLDGYLTTGSPSSFNLADLEAFATANPSAQRSVTIGSDVWTGISLNSFLSTFINRDTTVPKNDILRDYVVATGTDGYKAAFSMGEINPSFGNQNDIIAYQLNGQDLTTSGFARIVAPGDVRAGRWVSNLANLQVSHVPYTAGTGGVSSQLSVSGDVISPLIYTATNLPGSLSPSTVTVNSQPPSLAGTTFTGVSLLGVLNQSVIVTDPNVKNDILSKVVIATGTDGYQAVFSLGELLPNFGNQPDLLAYANTPGSPLGADGFARTVVPNDLKGGRYVSNLVSLEVVDASVPEPTTLALLAGGLPGLGFVSFRRRTQG